MSRARSLAALRREAATCTRCPLYANATQTVFGEGRKGRIMLVGEQPGDHEDRAGGRSSDWLVDCCARCSPRPDRRGRDVRHQRREAFLWRPRGTRRIHDKPSWSEVQAWALVEPRARSGPADARRLSWRDGRAVALRPLGAGGCAPRRTTGASRRVEGARHDPSLRRPAC